MRVMVVLLALASALTLAADNAVVVPQAATGPKPQATTYGAESITIPQMLSYQGKLTDTLGQPVPNGNYALTFRLYTQPSGGSAIWTEAQTVMVKSGLFSALLGAVTPIGSLPDAGALYLSLQVAADPELSPRLRIASAAYAYLSARAASSDLLQGKDTAALDARYVNEGQASSVTSNMLVDGTIAAVDLGQMGASSGQVMKWTGSAWAPRNDSVGSGGGGGDNAWVRGTPDSVLFTIRQLGVARGSSQNMLHGSQRFTHVNLGVACTTGMNGQNYSYCTVGGGQRNIASVNYATVAGGYSNTASNTNATVAGGYSNIASDNSATVGGGYDNTASGNSSTIGGGSYNTASGVLTFVGGGGFNVAAGYEAAVGGGGADTAKAVYGGVLSGYSNLAGDAAADTGATVCGGYDNAALDTGCFVGGGRFNLAKLSFAAVCGGFRNTANGVGATVGGGAHDTASSSCATVAGGSSNAATGANATVAGGCFNAAVDDAATVGGGMEDTASGYSATVAGGNHNAASASYSAVGGGEYNGATGYAATVAGGYGNGADTTYATVGGGIGSIASGYGATVGGGLYNVASGSHATVAGGDHNAASGYCATVAGGYSDTSAAYYSFTVGDRSLVPSSYNNSAAFNGQTATASSQTRVGVLSKASGTFTIDHPLDPNGRILNHYFIEGPEMLNIYRGAVVLDASGRAAVDLPAYFDALNRNPMVQLTGVGTNGVVYVAEDVSGNRFAIGGPAGAKVYWQVTGERQDVSAEATRRMMPVEQPKTGPLAGRMLDDDFLAGCMDQLVREGKAQGIDFRTAAGRQKYEKMKQLIEHR